MTSTVRVSQPRRWDPWGLMMLCCGACPGHGRVLGSIPGFYPLHPSPPDQKWLQTLITTCIEGSGGGVRVQNHSQLKTTVLKANKENDIVMAENIRQGRLRQGYLRRSYSSCLLKERSPVPCGWGRAFQVGGLWKLKQGQRCWSVLAKIRLEMEAKARSHGLQEPLRASLTEKKILISSHFLGVEKTTTHSLVQFLRK